MNRRTRGMVTIATVGLVLAGRLEPHEGLRGVGRGALLGGRLVHCGGVALVVVVVVPLVVVVVDVAYD